MALLEHDVDRDPLRQFERWFGEARAAGIPVPEATAVATATPDGRPSVRMVLVKAFDERGFVFFTGYGSRKGRELAANPHAALLVHWSELGRQVRIEGVVERVARAESAAYFRERPLLSRIAALASQQSRPIESRDALDARFAAARMRYGDDPALPEEWGGFRVLPETYEFWEHRENRLHDRLRYTRQGAAWQVERLQP